MMKEFWLLNFRRWTVENKIIQNIFFGVLECHFSLNYSLRYVEKYALGGKNFVIIVLYFEGNSIRSRIVWNLYDGAD